MLLFDRVLVVDFGDTGITKTKMLVMIATMATGGANTSIACEGRVAGKIARVGPFSIVVGVRSIVGWLEGKAGIEWWKSSRSGAIRQVGWLRGGR